MTCQPQAKDILDYLVSLAPVIISIFMLWIARAQYTTNNNKLKLDLYNRRFSVYEKTLDYYLAYMAREKSVELLDSCRKDFIGAYRESIFLFGEASPVYKSLTIIKDTLSFLIEYENKFGSGSYDKDECLAWSKIRDSKPEMATLMKSLEVSLAQWLDFRKIG